MPQKFKFEEMLLHALVKFGGAYKCPAYYRHIFQFYS